MQRSKYLIIVVMIILVAVVASAALPPAQAQDPDLVLGTEEIVREFNQLGGLAGAVAGAGDLLAAGIGRRLVLLDFVSANRFVQVGQSAPLVDVPLSIAVNEKIAYVAAGDGGLYVIDISNPRQPKVLWRDPVHSQQLLVHQGYLYVAAGASGLVIYDLSDAEKPELISRFERPGDYLREIDVKGDIAYIVGRTNLILVNISDQENPTLAGEYAGPGQNAIRDVAVSGERAFLSVDSEGLILLSVTNPASPHEIGRYDEVYTSGSIYLHDDLAIVNGDGIYVLDVKDEKDIRQLSFKDELHFKDASQYGDLLAMANGAAGISVISLKSLPQIRYNHVADSKSFTQIVAGDGVLIAGIADDRLQLLDISNPFSPQMRASLSFSDYVVDIAVSGHYAFVSVDDGVHIVDIANHALPREVALIPIKYPLKVMIRDNWAYVASSYDGLAVIDISDPSRPREVGSLKQHSEAAALGDEYVYLIERSSQSEQTENTLFVISVADPANPKILGSLPTDVRSITAVGKIIYGWAGNKIKIIDTSNPAAPQQKGEISGRGSPYAYRNRLYVPNYYRMEVYDIGQDPLLPEFIHAIDSLGGSFGITAVDKFLYVTKYSTGLSTMMWVEADSTAVGWEETVLQSADKKITYHLPVGALEGFSTLYHWRQPSGSLVKYPPLLPTKIIFANQAENIAGSIVVPLKPYQLEIVYDSNDLGLVQELSLQLLYYDGVGWQAEPSAQFDFEANKVTAEPEKFGVWALAGSAKWHSNFPVVTSRSGQTDLVLLAMEITQGVQSLTNSVPLVSGRPTIARIHVKANDYNPVDNVSLELEGRRNGMPLPGSPLRIDNWALFNQHDRSNLSHSFDFRLPAEWRKGTVNLTATLNPDHLIPESDRSNNMAEVVVQFNEVPPLNVTLVPLELRDKKYDRTCPAPSVQKSLADDVMRLFPINEMRVVIRDPIFLEANDLTGVLLGLSAVKNADGAPSSTVYYGVINWRASADTECFPDGSAGLGMIGRRVSVGGAGKSVLAHETGHNFGLYHAPCGDPAHVDQNYPYAEASIGEYGYDILSETVWSPGAPDFAKDFMSYCRPKWVSDYNYRKLLDDQRRNSDPTFVDIQPALLIRAMWNEENGLFDLAPIYQMETNLTQLPDKSRVQVELIGAGGAAVATYHLPIDEAQEEGQRYAGITAAVPLPSDQQIETIRLWEDGHLIAGRDLTSITERQTPAVLSTNWHDENITLSWPSNDRNALVRFRLDGSSQWTTYGIDIDHGSLTINASSLPEGVGGFEIIYADSVGESLILPWEGYSAK